jgi:hypothetical protein
MSVEIRSIADTALGFSAAELQILRAQQQDVENSVRAKGLNTNSAGRSQSLQGRILLDVKSLQSLQDHLENVIRLAGGKIDEVGVCAAPLDKR